MRAWAGGLALVAGIGGAACRSTPDVPSPDGGAENAAPTLRDVAIFPAAPTRGQVLTAVGTASDTDGDPVSVTWRWEVNGVEVAIGPTLADGFGRGDVVRVAGVPSDGVDEGALAASDEVVVGNAPPRITRADLLPVEPVTGDVVTVVLRIEDPDGDAAAASYAWSLNGAAVDEPGPALLAAAVARGDVVEVAVAVRDGLGGEAAAQLAAVVGNAPPEGGAAEVTPDAPRVGAQDLVCRLSGEVVDPEGDATSWLITWIRDGATWPDAGGAAAETRLLAGDTAPGPSLSAGEVWRCAAAPWDGVDAGPIVLSAPVTIAAPRVVELGMIPGRRCAVTDDQAVRCWGEDPPDGFDVASPPPVGWDKVVVGDDVTCVLDGRQFVTCWGRAVRPPPRGATRDLALTGTTGAAVGTDGVITVWGDDAEAMAPPPGAVWLSVVGSTTTRGFCALDASGGLECWGPDAELRALPPGPFAQVAVGAGVACGVDASGEAVCWGGGSLPEVTPPAGPWVEVAVGAEFACARDVAGALACWGSDERGQLQAPAGPWRAVWAEGAQACGEHEIDGLVCWGAAYGLYSAPPRGGVDALVFGGASLCTAATGGGWGCLPVDGVDLSAVWAAGPVELAANDDTVCGTTPGGDVVCGGAQAAIVAAPAGPLRGVSVGEAHACGINALDEAVCWGDDVEATAAPAGAFVSVSAGAGRSCGVRTDGVGVCWGAFPSPATTGLVVIDAGWGDHACGIDVNEEIVCWGAVHRGVTSAPRGRFVDVAVDGRGRSCGVRFLDRTIDCWGEDLGWVPDGEFVAVEGREPGFCGLTLNGEVRCWGGLAW